MAATQRLHELFQSYTSAYLHQCNLEAKYFAVNPTEPEQEAALLVEPTAGPKEGPMGIVNVENSTRDRKRRDPESSSVSSDGSGVSDGSGEVDDLPSDETSSE